MARKFNPAAYSEVKERIEEFVLEFPRGVIQTFMQHQDEGTVIFEARVFRTPEDVDREAYTSGWAREVEGGSHVNSTSHLENAETSAIGRALANMAYGTKKNRPSREEMLKVSRAEKLHERLLDYIRENFESIPEAAEVEIEGTVVRLAEYITDEEKGKALRTRLSLARAVVNAVEKVTQIRFSDDG
jgi:hypothetical protein